MTDRKMVPLEERPELPPSMAWSQECDIPNLARPHWRVLYTTPGGKQEELHRWGTTIEQDTPKGAADAAWVSWERMSGLTRQQYNGIK